MPKPRQKLAAISSGNPYGGVRDLDHVGEIEISTRPLARWHERREKREARCTGWLEWAKAWREETGGGELGNQLCWGGVREGWALDRV